MCEPGQGRPSRAIIKQCNAICNLQLLHNTFITAQLFVTIETNREKIEGGRCVSVVRVEEVKLPYPELDLTPGKNMGMSSSLKIFPC